MTKDSGRISVVDDTLQYRSASQGGWNVAIDELRVIGETTNQNGPWDDDHFICFACAADNWHLVPCGTRGLDSTLESLADRLGFIVSYELVRSTDFASRVIWPAELDGRPMFKYVDDKRSGVMGKLADLVFGPVTNTQSFADDVAEYLRETS